ncbi:MULTISPECIES: ABC transporter substrate-binding protein [unclassified Streptomyces]|uniref:ABC transporter substrate-binding protein n=1 Tax=unclassified Streptomyces TaxID=2593676 RepID=UPI002E2AC38F|nr:ABC transporter substrate-binding protein [Streptomyces sp. NBC_01429]
MRRLLIGLTALAIVAPLTACGSTDSPGGRRDDGSAAITVGVIPIVDVAPIYLGEKQGFYRDRGIDLTLKTGQGGAAIVPGVISGQFQFGFSNVTSLLVAQANKVPVRAVANGGASTGRDGADFGGITVGKDSALKTAKDLAGRKVAVNTLKNIGDTSVRESVRKAGGDPDRVTFVELAFDQMAAALDSGQVDAAWAVEPALSTIKGRGGRVIASNFVDVAPDLTVALYFTSAEYARRNPELVEKFRAATKESLAYATGHPDEVREILTTYTRIPEATLRAMTLPHWPQEPNRASIETLAALGEKDGIFKSAPDPDELLP